MFNWFSFHIPNARRQLIFNAYRAIKREVCGENCFETECTSRVFSCCCRAYNILRRFSKLISLLKTIGKRPQFFIRQCFRCSMHSEFIKNNKSEIIVQLNCDYKDVLMEGQLEKCHWVIIYDVMFKTWSRWWCRLWAFAWCWTGYTWEFTPTYSVVDYIIKFNVTYEILIHLWTSKTLWVPDSFRAKLI